MKKNLFILPILLLMAMSCVNNEDENNPVIPPVVEPSLPLTAENMTGEWEQYYFSKQVAKKDGSMNESYRWTDWDGFTTVFYDGNKYFEKNVNEDVIKEGKYEIVKDSIRFTFIDTTGVEKKTKVHIESLSSKRFSEVSRYESSVIGGTGKYAITDKRLWRNTKNMPGEHPDVTKMDISKDKLVGKWEIYDCQVFFDGKLDKTVSLSQLAPYKGHKIEFDADYKFAELEISNPAIGTYKIVDDVIHMFYPDPQAWKGVGSSTLWLTNWGKENIGGVQTEFFSDNEKWRDYSTDKNKGVLVERKFFYKRVS